MFRRRKQNEGEGLNRSWQSPEVMEAQRRSFADGFATTGFRGSMVMRWSFVAYPLQKYAVADGGADFATGLVRVADSFQLSMGALIESGDFRGMSDRIDLGLDVARSISEDQGCDRYRNLVNLYASPLGLARQMVRHRTVDWEFVADVERRAFDGEFTSTEW